MNAAPLAPTVVRARDLTAADHEYSTVRFVTSSGNGEYLNFSWNMPGQDVSEIKIANDNIDSIKLVFIDDYLNKF